MRLLGGEVIGGAGLTLDSRGPRLVLRLGVDNQKCDATARLDYLPPPACSACLVYSQPVARWDMQIKHFIFRRKLVSTVYQKSKLKLGPMSMSCKPRLRCAGLELLAGACCMSCTPCGSPACCGSGALRLARLFHRRMCFAGGVTGAGGASSRCCATGVANASAGGVLLETRRGFLAGPSCEPSACAAAIGGNIPGGNRFCGTVSVLMMVVVVVVVVVQQWWWWWW